MACGSPRPVAYACAATEALPAASATACNVALTLPVDESTNLAATLMSRLSYPRPSTRRPLVHLPHVVYGERVIRPDQQHTLRLRLGLLDLALLHYQSPVGERIAIVRCPVVPRLLRELAALLVVLV